MRTASRASDGSSPARVAAWDDAFDAALRVPVPISVRARLESLVSSHGAEAGYFSTTGEVLTWGGAGREADSWSEHFAPGTVVALCTSSPTAFCRAYLAGIANGLCVAPIDPRATPEELGVLLDALQVSDVVVDQERPGLEGFSGNVFLTSEAGLSLVSEGTDSRLPALGVAALLATSGSTGTPKLVPLSERQLLRVATRVVDHHKLTPDERGFSPLPLFHVNAQVVGVLSTLVAGSSLVVAERFQRSGFWKVAEELEVTWANLVPAILSTLNEEAPPPESVSGRIRFARSASSPLPAAVRERFEEQTGIGVLETYGMTEAASQIAANPLAPGERRPGSVGRPLGVIVRVVDEDGRELPDGEVGALEIAGQTVIDHYLGRDRVPVPARNDEGWLSTGDLARRDDDGFIFLVGRRDEVINRGGEKAYPGEIEDVLRCDPRVVNAAVVGRPHPVLGAEPVAFVIADPTLDDAGRAALKDALLERSRAALSRYKQPAEVILVDSLPTGATGKVLRRRLLAPQAASEVAREGHHEHPSRQRPASPNPA